jgi:hypothetical protein
MERGRVVASNSLAFAIRDGGETSPGVIGLGDLGKRYGIDGFAHSVIKICYFLPHPWDRERS